MSIITEQAYNRHITRIVRFKHMTIVGHIGNGQLIIHRWTVWSNPNFMSTSLVIGVSAQTYVSPPARC